MGEQDKVCDSVGEACSGCTNTGVGDLALSLPLWGQGEAPIDDEGVGVEGVCEEVAAASGGGGAGIGGSGVVVVVPARREGGACGRHELREIRNRR